MNKENCQDREGISHFSEFGWYDGFQGSCSNCRIGLDARNKGACESSDECAEACLENIRDTGQNIISENIANMHAGEKQKKKEDIEDKAVAVAKREEDKKKAEAAKKAKELEEAGKVICGECQKEVVSKEQKEVSQGVINCPHCNKPIEGQTGKKIEPKKEEVKPEEVKEPVKEEVKPVIEETPKEPVKEEPKNA